MNPNPKVSIIVPVFNREKEIVRCLKNLFEQTYQNKEIIIVDDGSTDKTPEVLANYKEKIQIIRQINSGPSVARNNGAKHANGDLFAFQDSDDVWSKDKIECQVRNLLHGGDSINCVICNAEVFEGGSRKYTSFSRSGLQIKSGMSYILSNPDELIASTFLLFNQTALITREVFQRVEGFREDLWLLEDYVLSFEISKLGKWIIDSKCMVKKYDQPDGIGVNASKKDVIHHRALRDVLYSISEANIKCSKRAQSILNRRIVEEEIICLAIALSRKNTKISQSLCWFLNRGVKITKKFSRRNLKKLKLQALEV